MWVLRTWLVGWVWFVFSWGSEGRRGAGEEGCAVGAELCRTTPLPSSPKLSLVLARRPSSNSGSHPYGRLQALVVATIAAAPDEAKAPFSHRLCA